jgi:predicted acetyltransferase
MSLEIRLVTPDDDLRQDLDLAHRAFGPMSATDEAARLTRGRSAAAAGRLLGAFDGSQMLGSAQYHEMRQWWAGQPVPMAGVGGVKVAPEERGRGTGRALVTEMLNLIAARGFLLSTLYPATLPLYRSLGWEIAGGRYQVSLPARAARLLAEPEAGPAGEPPQLRRAGLADADEVMAVTGRVHEVNRDCGVAVFEAADGPGAARELGDENVFCYLAADGYLAYQWAGGDEVLHIRRLLAASAQTTRALWSVVGSHAPMASTILATVGPDDPVNWLTCEPDVRMQRSGLPWMLRVISAAAAIAARRFPPAAELTAPLELTDMALGGNAGHWLLHVGGGQGTLTPMPPGSPGTGHPLRLGPRGFAALYAGTGAAVLRRTGLAAGGDPGTDALLDSAFAATPYMLDQF